MLYSYKKLYSRYIHWNFSLNSYKNLLHSCDFTFLAMRFHAKYPLFDSQSDREFTFSYAILPETIWSCLIKVNTTVRFIVPGTHRWMNELTDNHILLAYSPVVPASVVSPRSLTTSIWFEPLAVVSGVGCSKSVWSKCRISFRLPEGDTSDSKYCQE